MMEEHSSSMAVTNHIVVVKSTAGGLLNLRKCEFYVEQCKFKFLYRSFTVVIRF